LRLNLANSGQADSVDINLEFSKLDKELERQKKLILDQHRIKLRTTTSTAHFTAVS
jgi:hypothetical protein